MTTDDTLDLLRRTDVALRGVDAMQRVMEQILEHTREVASAKVSITELQKDVGKLSHILIEGNGESLVSQVGELRSEVKHLRERVVNGETRRWQVWLGVGLGALALFPEAIRAIIFLAQIKN